MTQHFIAMSGSHGCLPDFCQSYGSPESAAEAIGQLFELEPVDVRWLGNRGYLELGGPEYSADYAEIIGCNCATPSDHDDC